MRALSLCSGYGGLEMGLELAGVPVDLVAYAEFDKYASKVMAAHHPFVSNMGDIKKVDWSQLGSTAHPSVSSIPNESIRGDGQAQSVRSFVGADAGDPSGRTASGVELVERGSSLVDILTAGYPCQPFSQAGKRLGTDDPRHLWPYVAEAVRHIRPRHVFLENVRGHVTKGLPQVLADLADLGYVGSWGCFRASEVGACHRRERVFIVASDTGSLGLDGGQDLERAGRPSSIRGEAVDHPSYVAGTQCAAGVAPNASGERLGEHAGGASSEEAGAQGDHFARRPGSRWAAPYPSEQGLAGEEPAQRHLLPAGSRLPIDWGKFGPAIERWELVLGRPAPAPTEGDKHRLNPVFVEWMMGLPEGHVTGVAGISRTQQLKILGNGVVPQQAAFAWHHLYPVTGN